MRVLVDAHMVGQQETGNESYVVGLASALAAKPDISVAAAVTTIESAPPELASADVDLIPIQSKSNLGRLISGLSDICRHWNADILHSTYVSPLHVPCASVVSVHDISFKHFPEFFSPKDKLLFATLLPYSLRRADAVLTLSQHAKSEIVTAYSFLQDRIFVAGGAPRSLFRKIASQERDAELFAEKGIRDDYLLAVGNLQPRKNLLRLIKAFSLISEQFPKLQLVIVGKAQWQASAVYELVTSLNLGDAVCFTGYVSDEQLLTLYNQARVFIYPSLYEGFGLPVVEAMACGTPVITSNQSSLPEVAGSAALTVDPTDHEAMAGLMTQLLSDQTLAEELSNQGLVQAKAFTWAHSASQALVAYKYAKQG